MHPLPIRTTGKKRLISRSHNGQEFVWVSEMRAVLCTKHKNASLQRRHNRRTLQSKSYLFSFGYLCDHIPSESSLKGLHYKITISGTNDTVCSPFIFHSWSYDDDMQLRLLPNLLGQDNNLTFFTLLESTSLCYQDVAECLCYAFVLNEIDLNEIYPHCTNCSDDYLNGCGPRQGNRKFMNCPSLTEDFLCLYGPAGCKVSPPSVKNAKISTAYTMRKGYVYMAKQSIPAMKDLRWRETKSLVVCTTKAGHHRPSVHVEIPR